MNSTRSRAPLVMGALALSAIVLATMVPCRRKWTRHITRVTARRSQRNAGAVSVTSRTQRTAAVTGLITSVATDTAFTKARQVFVSAPRREILQHDLELRSAQAVAERLGNMKGALMKLGQMASYLHDGLPPHVRDVLSQLQQSAPPMSSELASRCIERELGEPPERLFVQWDPVPLASASIGQVHRAITRDGQAVAVKIQYPGVADAIASDLGTADLVFAALGAGFRGLNRKPVTDEIKARLIEELDYVREATNQQLFADFCADHPFIHIPGVRHDLSTGTVLTTELAQGVHLDEVRSWPQEQRDSAAEAVFRFVFRSLYRLHTFNGDPHPGNYLFRPDGQVTFLDFGLVRRFSQVELVQFIDLITTMVLNHDPAQFRLALARAGLLPLDAPASDAEIAEYFSAFYDIVRRRGQFGFTAEYANAIVKRTFDLSSPIAQYATVPAPFVIIQRINLGLYAILGSLEATCDWRGISDELWPMVDGPPSTPTGEAEAEWITRRAGTSSSSSSSSNATQDPKRST